MQAIIANHLSKIYASGKKAVQDLTFSINTGDILGLLGPNGAGKTTTVKLLSGMLSSSNGDCSVLDINPQIHPEKIHAISGVVTEHAQMYDNLTGLENLIFYGTVFGINKYDSTVYAKELLKKLDLVSAQNQKLSTYSTGMRQRLSLARAMIHKPKILFLDEPTSGLDPESTLQVNKFLQYLAKEDGVTILLCTHQLRYAQEICDVYSLIDNGQLLANGKLDELRKKISANIIVNIETDKIPKNIEYIQKTNQNIEIHIYSKKEIPAIIKNIVDKGGNIYSVTINEVSLEEIYFRLMAQKNKQEIKND